MFDSQSKKNPRNTVLGFKIAEAEEARTPDNLIKRHKTNALFIGFV